MKCIIYEMSDSSQPDALQIDGVHSFV